MVGGRFIPTLRPKQTLEDTTTPTPLERIKSPFLQHFTSASLKPTFSSPLHRGASTSSTHANELRETVGNSVLVPNTSLPSSPANATCSMPSGDERLPFVPLLIQSTHTPASMEQPDDEIIDSSACEFAAFDNEVKLNHDAPVSPQCPLNLSKKVPRQTKIDFAPSPNLPQAVSGALNSTLKETDIKPTFVSILSLPPLNKTHKLRRAKSDTFLLNPTKQLEPLPPHPRLPFLPLPIKNRLLPHYNNAAALSFAQRIVTAVNDASVCALVSIGHQLGLFAVLARLSPQPYPPHIIATATALRVRPVAEWLAAMACAGVVDIIYDDCDDDEKSFNTTYESPCDLNDEHFSNRLRYVLPVEHTPWLTWGSGTNFALLCQTIPALARVEHAIVSCYKRGVGLDQSVYTGYERILAYDVMQTIGLRILTLLRLAPPLMDKLSSGICVLCIGGVADAVYVRLARLFPRSWFTCYGTSERHAAAARKTVEDGDVTNVHFKTVRKMDDLRERDSYDATLVLEGGGIRECIDPVSALEAIRRAMRENGHIIYVEMMGAGDVNTDRKNRVGMFIYAVSSFYSVPKAMADGQVGEAVSGIWGHINVRNAMSTAGFIDISVHALEDDSLNCVLIARTSDAEVPKDE